MARISWAPVGQKLFEAGVSRGVLYPDGDYGVPWHGLIAVSENPIGGDPKIYYQDGEVRLLVNALEIFKGSIEAYSYPDEFAAIDGTAEVNPGYSVTQQNRKSFGLSYRTQQGNDLVGVEHGYLIHILYGLHAAPAPKNYKTIGTSADVTTFTWDYTAKPVQSPPGFRPTAHVIIDSSKTPPTTLAVVEGALYGTQSAEPYLPTPTELLTMFVTNYPGQYLIDPDPITGLSPLLEGEGTDLEGSEAVGLYIEGRASRLVETTTDGIFTLEE